MVATLGWKQESLDTEEGDCILQVPSLMGASNLSVALVSYSIPPECCAAQAAHVAECMISFSHLELSRTCNQRWTQHMSSPLLHC